MSQIDSEALAHWQRAEARCPFRIRHSLIGLSISLTLMTLVPIILFAQSLSPEAQVLRDMLSDANCQRACWQGMEPGITTQDEVKAYFASQNITYTIFAGLTEDNEDEANGIYYWKLDSSLPFIDPTQSYSSEIGFVNSIVGQMGLFLDVPVEIVLEAYGNPSHLLQGDGYYDIIYQTEGLVFQVNDENSNVTALVYLGTETAINTGFINVPVNPPVKNCSEPASICSIATATPTPTSTPILFASTRDEDGLDVYTMQAEGSNAHALTDYNLKVRFGPQWR